MKQEKLFYKIDSFNLYKDIVLKILGNGKT